MDDMSGIIGIRIVKVTPAAGSGPPSTNWVGNTKINNSVKEDAKS